MKIFFKYFTVFIIILIVFNLFMLLGTLFPSNMIENNVKESSKILINEGNIYTFFEFYDVTNNNFTDALMINEAYSIDSSRPFYSYMTARKNYKPGQTVNYLEDNIGEGVSQHNKKSYDAVGELKELLNGTITTSSNYARYWHGYLPILRTMLIFFNISQIRIILLLIFILLFIYLIYLLYKTLGATVAIIYSIALIIEDYFFVSYSLESAPVFMVMMLACIFVLKRIDKFKNWYIFVFIVACITNFVDYLTVPLITLAMPLYIYILYNQKTTNHTWKYYLKLIIISSLVWFLGYSLTWISKWVLYDLIYAEGLIESAITQVLYRSSRANPVASISIWGILFIMLFDKLHYILLTFSIILLLLIPYISKLKINDSFFKESLPILVVSLMPFVWYIVLANHTILHERFVYRHLLIFFVGLFIYTSKFFVKKTFAENH